MKSKYIQVYVFAKNEEKNIEKTIEKLIEDIEKVSTDYEIKVIDNASTDSTAKIIERINRNNEKIKLVRNEKDLGYAGSVKKALELSEGEINILIDGDGQQRLEELPEIISMINKGYDVIIGLRPNRRDEWYRLFLSSGYNKIFNLIFNEKEEDLDCGLRVIKRKLGKKIKIKYTDVPVGPEFFIRAKKLGFKIGRINVNHYYRKGGKSSFKVISFPILIMRVLYRLICLKMEVNHERNP